PEFAVVDGADVLVLFSVAGGGHLRGFLHRGGKGVGDVGDVRPVDPAELAARRPDRIEVRADEPWIVEEGAQDIELQVLAGGAEVGEAGGEVLPVLAGAGVGGIGTGEDHEEAPSTEGV